MFFIRFINRLSKQSGALITRDGSRQEKAGGRLAKRLPDADIALLGNVPS
jgi:hypothetical protein